MATTSTARAAPPAPRGAKTRAYLYEVDLVRVITALCVVGVHATAFTLVFYATPLGAQLQNGVVSALHFTREVFLSISAFVLVYGYAHRRYSLRRFWGRRGLGVLLPYIFWSLVYAWLHVPHEPLGAWLKTAGLQTLTGSASYQLYYILLSLELYLALPLILWFFARVERRPWMTLGISFALQLGMMYVDYNVLQVEPFASSRLGRLHHDYGWRLLPYYQFFIVLGGLGALYLDPLRAFARRHGRLIVGGLLLGLGALWVRYAIALGVQHMGPDMATAVFQPVVVVESAAVALFLYWLGLTWAQRRPAGGRPPGQRLVSTLSDASFGIYLVHAFILDWVLGSVGSRMPGIWPAPLRVLLVWLLAVSGAAALSVLFLYTPGLSRLVGRAYTPRGVVTRLRRALAPRPTAPVPEPARAGRSDTRGGE